MGYFCKYFGLFLICWECVESALAIILFEISLVYIYGVLWGIFGVLLCISRILWGILGVLQKILRKPWGILGVIRVILDMLAVYWLGVLWHILHFRVFW